MKKYDPIHMPEKANQIIHTLEEAGFEAYIVGGCVRDAILGKEPDDWDITTSAKPEDVKKLFRRTIDTGIEHGTVTVMFGKEGYEVTTYRVDGKYENHRRPNQVTFTASLMEDMKRRDFTINAMAYNETDGLVDHFNGMEDLNKGLIRCVGNPKERFDEDALRILRALRFSAQLNFEIEEDTKVAIQNQARFLKDISAERIQVELTKLLISNHPERLKTAYELGVTKVILPEFDAMMDTPQNNKHHTYNVGEHTLCVIENVPPIKVLRWTALLHDVAKPSTKIVDEKGDHFYGHNEIGSKMAKTILRRLKFDNMTIDRVGKLVYWHDYGIGDAPSLKSFRRFLSKIGADLFEDYIFIKKADICGQSDYRRIEKLENVKNLEAFYRKIIDEKQCLSLKELEVKGNDLISCGINPGKEIGIILNDLLNLVLEDPEMNKREILLEHVKSKIKD